jgi:glycosyltransferase involved in cell wall biosynthesis
MTRRRGRRILLVSNAFWAGTGYGTQITQLAIRLRRAGHKVALFANYGLGGSRTKWNGFPVYPAALDASGNEMLYGHARHWNADLVIILYDAFTLNAEILKAMPSQVCIWQPVDCEPMSRADLQIFRFSGVQPIAMSRFGQRMMDAEGLDPLYAPHGVDTETLFVPPEVRRGYFGPKLFLTREQGRNWLRAEARDLGVDIPDDAFCIGINVHNKDADRKAIWEQMSAFALFHRDHPDSLLFLHTMPHPALSGNDLIGMADFLGIGKACRWADPYSLMSGDYTPEDIAKWYARLNLYTGAARAGGFELPLIEAQACGVPVVTTDCSAMAENAGPGWVVGGQPIWQRGHKAIWVTPDVGELVHAYTEAYDGQAEARSDDARAFATQFNVDDVFMKYWEPTMECLGGLWVEELARRKAAAKHAQLEELAKQVGGKLCVVVRIHCVTRWTVRLAWNFSWPSARISAAGVRISGARATGGWTGRTSCVSGVTTGVALKLTPSGAMRMRGRTAGCPLLLLSSTCTWSSRACRRQCLGPWRMWRAATSSTRRMPATRWLSPGRPGSISIPSR